MTNRQLLEPLCQLAIQAGDRIMAVYQRGARAEIKGDGSPVTEADKAAEQVIVTQLAELAEQIAIISEENAASHQLEPPERFFLVDPLDGTREFLKFDDKGEFTVNIALIERGEPVLGVIYAPALGRLFFGAKHLGAFERIAGKDQPLNASQARPEPIAVASCSHRDDSTELWLEQRQIAQTIAVGSSLKFCLLASGEADLYPRFGPTMEWDTAAGDALLRAAGGEVVDLQGKLLKYGKTDYRNGPFCASRGPCNNWP